MLVGQVNQVHNECMGTDSSKMQLLSVGESQRFAKSKGVLGHAAWAHTVLHPGSRLPLCTPLVLLVIVHGQHQAENVTYQWATEVSRHPEVGLHRQKATDVPSPSICLHVPPCLAAAQRGQRTSCLLPCSTPE